MTTSSESPSEQPEKAGLGKQMTTNLYQCLSKPCGILSSVNGDFSRISMTDYFPTYRGLTTFVLTDDWLLSHLPMTATFFCHDDDFSIYRGLRLSSVHRLWLFLYINDWLLSHLPMTDYFPTCQWLTTLSDLPMTETFVCTSMMIFLRHFLVQSFTWLFLSGQLRDFSKQLFARMQKYM